MASTNGIRKEFQQLDSAVWKWASKEMEIRGEYPQKKVIQVYALKLYKDAGQGGFKASVGWYHKWRRRYGLSRIQKSCKKSENHTNNVMKVPNRLSTEILPANGLSDTVNSRLKTTYTVDEISNFRSRLSKKFCKYDQEFKNEVIRSCGEGNILEIAAKYKVHPNTISVWLKDDQFRKGLTKNIYKKSDVIKVFRNCEREVREREKEFIDWLRDTGKNKTDLSKSEVTDKIRCLFSSDWSGESHWFAKYCQRCVEGKSSFGIRIHYSEEFQKLLVNYASITSQLRTASVFNVPRKQLFNWAKKHGTSKSSSKMKSNAELLLWYESQELKPDSFVVRKKAKEIFPDDYKPRFSYSWYYKWCAKHGILVNQNLDEKIVEWILFAYDQNLYVSHHDVRKKALEIYQKQYKGSFKASSGWLLQFCRRYMDLIRRIPSLDIQLPSSYEREILSFRDKVCQIISENNMQSESLGIMDEIPLKLKPSGPVNKDEQKPLLRSCDFGNAQGSIILCCLASGVILPPVITLRDKNMNSSSGIYHVLYRQTEVIDESIIHYWLNNVWFRNVRQPNFLLLDHFAPHINPMIKNKFEEHNSFVQIIPGGCSSKLNPLTQIISSQLQDAIDTSCKKWYHENRLSWLGGNISLSSGDILDWVTKAFEQIKETFPSDEIQNVFKEMRLLTPEIKSMSSQ